MKLDDSLEACPIIGSCVYSSLCTNQTTKHTPAISTLDLKRHEFLYRGPTTHETTQVVIQGLLVLTALTESGEKLVTHIFGRGSTIGEVEAFMPEKSDYCIVALSDCTLCTIPNKTVLDACNSNSELLIEIIKASGYNQGQPGQQLWVLRAPDLPTRLRRQFLVLASFYAMNSQHDWIELQLSHEDIALLVNSSRTSVTHALRLLADRGEIKLGYGKVYLRKETFKMGRNTKKYPFATWQTPSKPWLY